MELTRQQLSDYIAVRRVIESKTRTFDDWLPEASPNLQWDLPHLVCMRQPLNRILNGETLKVMFFTQPQVGKSTHNSIHFPAFYLYKFQANRVLLGAHTQEFANRFSRQIRNLTKGYVDLSKERNAVGEWETQLFGGLNAGGVGIGTGLASDLVVIDDPIKTNKDVKSKSYRNDLWEWWTTSIDSRITNKTSVIFTMTRHHQDDLAGRILDAEGDEWIVINLPAICESENDPMGREIGTALWPERFPLELLKKKRKLNPAKFASLYQQRPSAEEGETFKREDMRYYKKAATPVFKTIIQSADLAYEDKNKNDPSVILTWGVTSNAYYLIDVWRKRCLYPEMKKALLANAAKYKPHKILIEKAASGHAIIPELKANTRLIIESINPHGRGSKEARAAVCTDIFAAHKVFLLDGAPWLMDYVEELAMFPNGLHDDQVDATSQFLQFMTEKSGSDPVFIGF